MVIDFMSRFSATKSMIINSIILHTSFRRVCWPPLAPRIYTCRYYNAYVYFCPYQENTVHALTYADGTGIILIGQDLNGQPRTKFLFPKRELPLWLQQGGYFFLTVIVTDFISRFSATKRMIINSIILHTSFRMVCWPPLALGIILVDIIMLM